MPLNKIYDDKCKRFKRISLLALELINCHVLIPNQSI